MKLSTSRLLAFAVAAAIPAVASASFFDAGGLLNSETVMLGPVDSQGVTGTLVSAGTVGSFTANEIVVNSGDLTEVNTATFAGEANIALLDGGGTFLGTVLDPFGTAGGFTGTTSLAGPVTVDASGAPFSISGLQLDFFESFDDGADAAADATWDAISITFNERSGGAGLVNEGAAAGTLNAGDTFNDSSSHVSGGFDLFTFSLSAASVVDFATTDPTGAGNAIDTEIAIFDSNGVLLFDNDDAPDDPGTPGIERISLLEDIALAAGDYTLVTSTFDTVWADGTPGDVISGSTAGTGSGDYDVSIAVDIPEPGSLALLGLGGLALLRRRR